MFSVFSTIYWFLEHIKKYFYISNLDVDAETLVIGESKKSSHVTSIILAALNLE